MLLKKIILLCFVLVLFYDLKSQPVDQIISKYIEFIGGDSNWKHVNTLITSGEYNYGGIKFPFTAYSKAPNLYKFVVPFEGKYYAQAFDGYQGWKIDAFKNETKPTMLTGKAAKAMANEADVELEDTFINYRQKGHKAIDEGTDTVDEKICSRVKLIRKSGAEETYYFDRSSGSLVLKIGLSKNAELPGTLLNTTYSDYRDVQGIKIPFKAVSKSNDQIILEITLNKAEINATIDDKEFQY